MDRQRDLIEQTEMATHATLALLGGVAFITLLVHSHLLGGHTIPIRSGDPQVARHGHTLDVSLSQHDLLSLHEQATVWICPSVALIGVLTVAICCVMRIRNLRVKAGLWSWRRITLARDIRDVLRTYAIGGTLYFLSTMFGLFVALSSYLDGSARDGYIEAGRAFVRSHGTLTEVDISGFHLLRTLEPLGWWSITIVALSVIAAIVWSALNGQAGGLRR